MWTARRFVMSSMKNEHLPHEERPFVPKVAIVEQRDSRLCLFLRLPGRLAQEARSAQQHVGDGQVRRREDDSVAAEEHVGRRKAAQRKKFRSLDDEWRTLENEGVDVQHGDDEAHGRGARGRRRRETDARHDDGLRPAPEVEPLRAQRERGPRRAIARRVVHEQPVRRPRGAAAPREAQGGAHGRVGQGDVDRAARRPRGRERAPRPPRVLLHGLVTDARARRGRPAPPGAQGVRVARAARPGARRARLRGGARALAGGPRVALRAPRRNRRDLQPRPPLRRDRRARRERLQLHARAAAPRRAARVRGLPERGVRARAPGQGARVLPRVGGARRGRRGPRRLGPVARDGGPLRRPARGPRAGLARCDAGLPRGRARPAPRRGRPGGPGPAEALPALLDRALHGDAG